MVSSLRSWFANRGEPPRLAPGGLPLLRPLARDNALFSVGVLVYQGITTAEVGEPVLRLAEVLDATVWHVGLRKGAIVGVEPAREVSIDLDVHEAPVPDVLVLPGGIGWRRIVDNTQVMTWVSYVSRQTQGVLAISTGSLILAAAGRLQGEAATGHWLARRDLARLGALVRIDRIAQSDDSRIITASGANSAMLAAEQLGERVRWGPA